MNRWISLTLLFGNSFHFQSPYSVIKYENGVEIAYDLNSKLSHRAECKWLDLWLRFIFIVKLKLAYTV